MHTCGLFVEGAPDRLRVDGHHVGCEGEEVVSGVFDGHVARVPVHQVAFVHVADVVSDNARQADLVGCYRAREPAHEEETDRGLSKEIYFLQNYG